MRVTTGCCDCVFFHDALGCTTSSVCSHDDVVQHATAAVADAKRTLQEFISSTTSQRLDILQRFQKLREALDQSQHSALVEFDSQIFAGVKTLQVQLDAAEVYVRQQCVKVDKTEQPALVKCEKHGESVPVLVTKLDCLETLLRQPETWWEVLNPSFEKVDAHSAKHKPG